MLAGEVVCFKTPHPFRFELFHLAEVQSGHKVNVTD